MVITMILRATILASCVITLAKLVLLSVSAHHVISITKEFTTVQADIVPALQDFMMMEATNLAFLALTTVLHALTRLFA